MLRKLPVLLVGVLGLASSAGAQEAQRPPEHRSPTPAWAPRGVLLGVSAQDGLVASQTKVQWQFTFYQDRKDAFALLLEGSLSWGLAFPDAEEGKPQNAVRSFYQHSPQLGVGYRNHLPGQVHWGFQVTGGPVFYGADFDGGLEKDRRVAGLIEGRVHLGYQFGDIAGGLAVGYAEAFGYKRRSLGRFFVGGPMVGLFVDWR
ncbi:MULTISPECIES: hypothetical protein [Myxococcus]|uniref:Lipoprotein n=1 Tax=Myxococcus xanthus TaxID=34 RepID=A0AAE6KTH8_MYXXA|nr:MULTISPECIES: hypothetical protein [Myxococcus]QDE69382.1 hypothetical protein BHS09_21700 [Myxococcus xanthus]QDE76659.1 hypothetical protein BHS08_21715 [Myxococcus xanthus]QDE84079.1 hypothetical protein BHS07_22360 [Myxococcus xanthus]QDE98230.1 hypothetical protein BHS05_21605 [Myxococcus xanthus]QDF05943.1 hypothetical protein BHS04_22435 [Myxococcus xanthus]